MPRSASFALAFLPFFLLASTSASAQSLPPIQKVEISAPSGLEQRRNDTAGRVSITRDDITRFGDVSVAALLKRQAGIAVVNGEVRMRGLGAGYTQILIDGEPSPPGFSVDSLAPAMIERIDIMRNGSAEFGAQAIAGSINIIMRKNHVKPQRDVTLGAAAARGYLVDPSAALRWADQHGDIGWSLGLELSRPSSHYDRQNLDTEFDRDGLVRNARLAREKGESATNKVSLSPRLNWKLGGGDSLAWQAVVDRSIMRNAGCTAETVLQGEATTYPDNCYRLAFALTGLRSDVAWTRTIGPGKLVSKLAFNRYDRKSDYLFSGVGSTASLARRVQSTALDDTTSLSGKYLAPLGSEHSLGLGWDGGQTKRAETRDQLDTTGDGQPPSTLNEDYAATVKRMALFAQDEWDVTPRLQLYLGLRWEGLQTEVTGRTMQAVSNSSSVFSPVAQMLWKLPDAGKDQVRLALSRTYKPPLTRLLVPRRYSTNNGNSPTNPDFRGNPNLRPERAWGLDAGYETYFGKDGVASLSAYVRHVDGVTVETVDPDIRPWLASPSNQGSARVAGIEADTKFSPQRDLDVRANLGYNWSSLAAVPGPDNRLAEQVALTSNLGFDYRHTPAMTFGANLNLQFGGAVRVSAVQTAYTGPVRNLSVYGLWKTSEKSKWRLALSDALQQDLHSQRAYSDASGGFVTQVAQTDRLVLRLTLETRL